MKSINYSSYKYILFVDASGDDGYKFGANSNDGSSFSYVVSCFVTTPDELDYNKDVLLKMKQAISVKPEQELKSTALKRHRYADKVYDEMGKLHGFAYSLVTDKRLIMSSPDKPDGFFGDISILARECLSGITHVFPFIALIDSGKITDNDKVLIVIDNMKKREMNDIKSLMSTVPYEQYDLLFRDSKDKEFSLIQIADIFSGTVRSYYEDTLPIKAHNNFCKSCSLSIIGKAPANLRRLCNIPRNKKLYRPYISNRNFNITLKFHTDDTSKTICGDHFIILPVNQLFYYEYIDCLIFGLRPWTKK